MRILVTHNCFAHWFWGFSEPPPPKPCKTMGTWFLSLKQNGTPFSKKGAVGKVCHYLWYTKAVFCWKHCFYTVFSKTQQLQKIRGVSCTKQTCYPKWLVYFQHAKRFFCLGCFVACLVLSEQLPFPLPPPVSFHMSLTSPSLLSLLPSCRRLSCLARPTCQKQAELQATVHHFHLGFPLCAIGLPKQTCSSPWCIFGIVHKVFSEKASAIARMRQKCVRMGLVLLGKEGAPKMRQKSVKIASKMRQKCAEHLWGRTPFGRYRYFGAFVGLPLNFSSYTHS